MLIMIFPKWNQKSIFTYVVFKWLKKRLGTLDLHLVVPVFKTVDDQGDELFVCPDFFGVPEQVVYHLCVHKEID